MKHVFVETNFLVSLLRPRRDRGAVDLFDRNDGVSLRIYIPWCSQAEARRTLPEIIKADLGFTEPMMAFILRRWLADPTLFDKNEIDKVKALVEEERRAAFKALERRITDAVSKLTLIDPSPTVIARTLKVFAVKALKPFDEMVLGAVLAKATELHADGERDLCFCQLDRDLASQHPPLRSEYSACSLQVRRDFDVKP